METAVWQLALASAENFVILCSGMSLLAFAVSLPLRIGGQKLGLHPMSLTRLFAAALVIPPVASAWIVIASLLPTLWLGSSKWVEEHGAAHNLHLLNSLTVRYDPFLGYAALAFVFATAAMVVSAAVRAYIRFDRLVGCLQVNADPAMPERINQVERACKRYGIEVGLVVSRYPFSFIWGYLGSKLIISTGLLNALSAEELSALLEHEAGHHARRDNLLKWFLSGCRYASLAFPLSGLLYRWWSEQIELVCDEVAARRTKAPIEVAAALVKLRRLTVAPPTRKPQSVESGFFSESDTLVERRVTRLLSLAGQSGKEGTLLSSRSWLGAATLMGMLFASTLVTLFLSSPLAVHRLIEALLRAFVTH
jgi:Zn-dependent protease with chaperone function